MKTIFEKSNNIDGINFFEEEKTINFIDKKFLRQDKIGLPQTSELEVLRHYKTLSDRNFCIEKGFYPLGSCTMKYNPKVNEMLANLDGFLNLHPSLKDEDVQGALELMFNLQEALKIITGMDAVSLQPAAGAHGEFSGMMIVKKYFENKGEVRKKVIIPEKSCLMLRIMYEYIIVTGGWGASHGTKTIFIHSNRFLINIYYSLLGTNIKKRRPI